MPVHESVRGDRSLQLLRVNQDLYLQGRLSHGRLPQRGSWMRRRWIVSAECGSGNDGSAGGSGSHVRDYLRGTASLLQSPIPREPLHLQHPQPPPDERLAVQRQKAGERAVRRLRHGLGGGRGRGQDAQPHQEGGGDHCRHRDRGLRSPSRRRRRRRPTTPSEPHRPRGEAPGHTTQKDTAAAAGDGGECPPLEGAARGEPTGSSPGRAPGAVAAPTTAAPRRARASFRSSPSTAGAGAAGSLWAPGHFFANSDVGFTIQNWIKLNCRRSCVLGTTSLSGTF
ncbi:uncharacterized protein LOC134765323 isoform X4 [Penaeus indicus]|uniref:uncharacterized protein LOC134765323 isoform X4 n=1 Tax=Penaeus indicus TaxID=29960 RepID=UPI00300D0FE8